MQDIKVHALRSFWPFLLALCATSGVASQEIGGRVITQEGLPIEAATVRLFPAGKYGVTDAQGRFSIASSSSGLADDGPNRFLEASHLGYRTERFQLSGFDDLSSIEIILTESTTDLQEVVVTDTRILEKVVNNSQSVITVDEEFISKNSTGTFSGALAALPGLNTMNLGVGIAKPMIRAWALTAFWSTTEASNRKASNGAPTMASRSIRSTWKMSISSKGRPPCSSVPTGWAVSSTLRKIHRVRKTATPWNTVPNTNRTTAPSRIRRNYRAAGMLGSIVPG